LSAKKARAADALYGRGDAAREGGIVGCVGSVLGHGSRIEVNCRMDYCAHAPHTHAVLERFAGLQSRPGQGGRKGHFPE
jgi:hypothetical protein